MMMAKQIGRATSRQARAMVARRGSSGGAERSRRSAFSTMTMVPSTIMPMAMAMPPSDMRLAERPNRCIASVANSTEKGMARATTTLGRKPPMKVSRISTTSTMPCTSACVTVVTDDSTRVFCW